MTGDRCPGCNRWPGDGHTNSCPAQPVAPLDYDAMTDRQRAAIEGGAQRLYGSIRVEVGGRVRIPRWTDATDTVKNRYRRWALTVLEGAGAAQRDTTTQEATADAS